MPSVLFVCFANRFRSPLAAAFFNHELEQLPDREKWSVSSAGTWTSPGMPVDKRAVQDAAIWGLDISAHRTRQVDSSILSQADLVLVMESGQKEALRIEFPKEEGKVFLLSEAVEKDCFDIPDPFKPDGIPHLEIAKELHDLISQGFNNICQQTLDSQEQSSKSL